MRRIDSYTEPEKPEYTLANITMNKERRALIIGDHPIKESIVSQFASLKYEIKQSNSFCQEELKRQWNDIFVLSTTAGSTTGNDAERISIIEAIYTNLVQDATCRPTIHLLLENQESCDLLNHRDYNDDWHTCFELNAFTLEDIWAKNILCPSAAESEMCGLDYRPIAYDCNHTIHLVLFGTNQLSSALMENAALVAHYPNYTRNHSLRTRITVIDNEINEWRKKFICTHKPLMENSYYRLIDISKEQCDLHKPMYEGLREDFVDVEWEFVNGSLLDLIVQDKLQGWADDDNQVLSVAVCHNDDSRNLSEATLIADLLCDRGIPVYVKQSSSVMKKIISQSPRLKNVIMIGMNDCGYDISLPLLKMAKRVNSVYEYCYNNNIASQTEGCITAPSFIDDKDADAGWLNVRKAIKRYSNICNAMTLATKMRSLGHSADETDTFYAITKQEIDRASMNSVFPGCFLLRLMNHKVTGIVTL